MSKFAWKRFWCPTDGKIYLDSAGFLSEPEGKYGQYYNPDVVGFDKLRNTPCLILLGEPGIGKSQTIQDEIERLQESGVTKTDDISFFNLKEYGSEDRLVRDLFESETWSSFVRGKHKLHLFIDSLDEVRLQIPQVTSLIHSVLKKTPRERLFFRIACRTAELPWSFKEKLETLWPNAQTKVYELVPLRQDDVLSAAKSYDIVAEEALNAIIEKKAGPLAAKPVTLKLLLNIYQKDGGFPDSEVALYEKGCLILCEEPDQERREKGEIDKRYVGELTPEQRFAVAARIAAVLVFGNRFAVSTDIDRGDLPEGVASAREIGIGIEHVQSQPLHVDERAIRETLKTGLFTLRGAGKLGFAHQTYAEFLAARYIKDAPIEQVYPLLLHSATNPSLVPQLHETAAWLSEMRADVLEWLSSSWPEVLLRSDVTKTDEIIKKSIVSALMGNFISEKLMDDRDFRDHYGKLSHGELFSQLAPIISDKSLKHIPRRVAMEIADHCKCTDLAGIICDIVLDQSEDYRLRTEAAEFVVAHAPDDIKLRLEPLAEGNTGSDADLELLAYGFRCMWPKYWSTEKLLEHIVSPNERVVGSYNRFLHEFVRLMGTPELREDLWAVIAAIRNWPYDDSDRYTLRTIVDELVTLAWSHIPEEKIMQSLAGVVLDRITNHEPLLSSSATAQQWKVLQSDEIRRRSMIQYMIEKTALTERNCVYLIYGMTRLILDSDFLWLLERLEGAAEATKPVWARCVVETSRDEHSAAWQSQLLEVRLRVPILEERVLIYWAFDSDISKQAKANYLELRRMENDRPIKKKKETDPSPEERVEMVLPAIMAGDVEKWHDLTYILAIDWDASILRWPERIEGTVGWPLLSDGTQRKVRETARGFLKVTGSLDDEWFGKGTYKWKNTSVYMALRIVSENRQQIDELPVQAWPKYVPYIVDSSILEDDDGKCKLLKVALEKAPLETIKYYGLLIDRENERHGNVHFIHHYRGCWDHALTPVLLERMRQGSLKPESVRSLVDFLSEHCVEDVEDILVEKMDAVNDDGNKEIAVLAAAMLLRLFGEKYWTLVSEFMHQKVELQENILITMAQGGRGESRITDKLSEATLAELYSLLVERYPVKDDPEIGGLVTQREMLADFRSGVFMALVNRGSLAACAAIESLIRKYSDDRYWMTWRLREAQENMLRKTWQPPSPADIIGLLQDASKRYVANEDQLLSVTMDSLNRMVKYYRGELAPLERLWMFEGGGNKRKNFRPKDEESLSDEIARWLKDDLGRRQHIVVNREVQPRRGQKTDIYINSTKFDGKTDSSDTLVVVVEVKGCWNPDVMKAMETQLLQQYLVTNNYKYGLFVVGWYYCPKWDNSDGRKEKTPFGSLADFRLALIDQCNELNKRNEHGCVLKSLILDLSIKT